MGTNHEQLSCEERTMIQLSLEQGCMLRAIARSMHRAPSSISRELARNGWSNPAAAPKKRGRLSRLARAALGHRQAHTDQHPRWLPGRPPPHDDSRGVPEPTRIG